MDVVGGCVGGNVLLVVLVVAAVCWLIAFVWFVWLVGCSMGCLAGRLVGGWWLVVSCCPWKHPAPKETQKALGSPRKLQEAPRGPRHHKFFICFYASF